MGTGDGAREMEIVGGARILAREGSAHVRAAATPTRHERRVGHAAGLGASQARRWDMGERDVRKHMAQVFGEAGLRRTHA